MMNFLRNGFTLVELIIVVAIITVLSSISFLAMSGETSNARDAKRRSDLQSIDSAIQASNAQNRGLRFESVITSGTHVTDDRILKNVGDVRVLRYSSGLELKTGFVPPSLLPTVSKDPKGDAYVGAFLTSNLYQIVSTIENADTKVPTALLMGTFKEEAVVDRLMLDISNSVVTFEVGKANQFVPGTVSIGTPSTTTGDAIRIDDEVMAVTAVNLSTNTLTVTRGFNSTAKMHNEKAEVVLQDFAANAGSLFCVGDLIAVASGVSGTDSDGHTNIYICDPAEVGGIPNGSIIVDGEEVIPYEIR